MTAALCESKAYFHPVIWSIITQRLVALSWNLKDIALLWLFIVPASLIPNTTSSVCTCYIFTGNSSERQRQTWIVEMTRSQRYATVCFARGARHIVSRDAKCKLNCKWLHLLWREQSRALQNDEKKSHHQQHAVPVTPTCTIPAHPIWKYDKTFWWQAFIHYHALVFKFSKYWRIFSSRLRCSKIISSNLKF